MARREPMTPEQKEAYELGKQYKQARIRETARAATLGARGEFPSPTGQLSPEKQAALKQRYLDILARLDAHGAELEAAFIKGDMASKKAAYDLLGDVFYLEGQRMAGVSRTEAATLDKEAAELRNLGARMDREGRVYDLSPADEELVQQLREVLPGAAGFRAFRKRRTS